MRISPLKRVGLSVIGRGFRFPEGPGNRYQELFHLRQLLDELEINCVIDVGASTGMFATELRAIGYEGAIRSFEPVRSAFAELEDAFGSDSQWRGYRLALGDEDKTAEINVATSITEMSSFLTLEGDWGEVESEQVEVRRLEGLFEEIIELVAEPRVFLKLDTQGFDLEVFEGAGSCLGRIEGLQSELSVVPFYKGMPTYLESLATFEQAGFVLSNLSIVSRSPEGPLQELNAFMKRSDAH
jgi:FkbM family methyltransferase